MIDSKKNAKGTSLKCGIHGRQGDRNLGTAENGEKLGTATRLAGLFSLG